MDSPPIPGELLLDIFLRLPDPADLARASAACASFRRLVADRSFLRQYRRLHAPPLLGFIDILGVFHRASPPYPSASAARAVAIAADFSFSFLPATAGYWIIQDSRDGRVLFNSALRENRDGGIRAVLEEMVVCDPLHRRCLLLPPIPGDLAAMVEEPVLSNRRRFSENFLVPSGAEDVGEETSFRVIRMVLCETQLVAETKLVAFVFSSGTGQWRALPPQNWSNLFGKLLPTTRPTFAWRKYAYGCFYWLTNWREKLLVLDTRRMKFSMADAPPLARNSRGVDIAMVEAGESRVAMFVRASNTSCLKYTIRQNNGGSSGQWQREKTISLGSECVFLGSMGRYLLLYKYGSLHDAGCFSLDTKTFQLERVNTSKPAVAYTYAYAYCNFPPSLLSTPTVSSGSQEGAEKKMLKEQSVEAVRAEEPVDADAGGPAGVSRTGDGVVD